MALALAACASNPERLLVAPKPKTFEVPEELFNCPELKDWPNPKTLTDGQIARLLIKLTNNNRTCKLSNEAIRAYIRKQKDIIG